MGKRGPAPKPTALRILHGDKNKSRINTEEPTPALREVAPPSWLSPEALEVWDQFAPDLVSKQVLTPWDTEAFAIFCGAVVRHRTASRHLDTEGEVIQTCVGVNKAGEPILKPIKNPWQLIWKETAQVIKEMGARFGLTPSDRSQIKTTAPDEPKGAERILS